MPTLSPARIKVIAESPSHDLDRFASERSMRLEWTVSDAFLDLCERHRIARRGATAWSMSGEEDNAPNVMAFVRDAVATFGPLVQGRSFPSRSDDADAHKLRRSLAAVVYRSVHCYNQFIFAEYPGPRTAEHNLLMLPLARIVMSREAGGIWIRLQTAEGCADHREYEALTYPSMKEITPQMRRPSHLTPLEADEALRAWTRAGRADVEIDEPLQRAIESVTRGIVVGYQAGAPAKAVIRAGRNVKGGPASKAEKSITLKRIVSMRDKHPKLTFYVHPSLDDIIAMNAAQPHDDERLRLYQREAVGLHLATSIGYLQACDTGAGKTVMQLAAMAEKSKKVVNYRGLIICEATMREQWQEEAEIWFPAARLVFVKAGKDAEKVADALAIEGPVVVVTSYAHVVSALDESERRAKLLDPNADLSLFDDVDPDQVSLGAMLLDTRWNDASADEAVSIRNNASKQSKALWAIRDNIDVATALTATPRNKSHDDLGHLLAWVRGDRHMFVGQTKLSVAYNEHKLADAKRLFKTLGPLIFRRDASEFADELPDTNAIVEYLTPTPAEKMLAHAAETELKRIYYELVEALAHAERMGDADPEQLAEARKALQEAHGAWLGGTTLARMTMSDPVSIMGSKSVGAKLLIAQGLVQGAIDSGPSKRAKFLADVAERVARGEQVLVFTSYETVAKLLVQHLHDAGISAGAFTGKNLSQRDRNRIAFQGGELDVLVATSAGTRGLTLTAATAVIHYDLPWTIEQVIQRTGRIVRFGSAHSSVDIVFYVLQGTIEERIAKHLIENGEAATMVLDVARGSTGSGGGVMQALGGLIKQGKVPARKGGKSVKGAVEFGQVVLGI